ERLLTCGLQQKRCPLPDLDRRLLHQLHEPWVLLLPQCGQNLGLVMEPACRSIVHRDLEYAASFVRLVVGDEEPDCGGSGAEPPNQLEPIAEERPRRCIQRIDDGVRPGGRECTLHIAESLE